MLCSVCELVRCRGCRPLLVLPTWYFWVSVLGVKLPLRFIKLSFARWLLIDMLPTVRFWSPFCEEAVTFFEACFEWLDELSAFCLAFDVFLATGFELRC